MQMTSRNEFEDYSYCSIHVIVDVLQETDNPKPFPQRIISKKQTTLLPSVRTLR